MGLSESATGLVGSVMRGLGTATTRNGTVQYCNGPRGDDSRYPAAAAMLIWTGDESGEGSVGRHIDL